MKNLFLINTTSIGANYGVGTYVKQIASSFCHPEIRINVVHLRAAEKEVCSEIKDGVRYIYIPSPAFQDPYRPDDSIDRFYRSVVYLLMTYIDLNEENIFHLNYVNQYKLAEELKKRISCRVVLTIHYFEWIFTYGGDRKRLQELYKIPEGELTTEQVRMLRCVEQERLLFSVCDQLIAPAEHSAETLRLIYGVESSKITVIPHALQDRYRTSSRQTIRRLRDRYYIEGDEPLILFVGRTERLKGIDYLTAAFKIVLKRFPKARLFIAGGSDIRRILPTLNPVWSKVGFTGFLNPEELDDLYRMADVGVVPSLYEEFGFVALEMMMHGLPVIANRKSGLNELIRDGVSGCFVRLNSRSVDRKSVGLLADSICALLADPDFSRRLGKGGRQDYCERFQIEPFCKRLAAFYLNRSV